jgi:hypothetical protein
MSKVLVVEQTMNVPYLVDNFTIILGDLRLNESVAVGVQLYYGLRQVHHTSFVIEGEEYAGWGNDDNYLKNLVASKLGLTPLAVLKSDDRVELVVEDLPQI